jgi:hypothetical protein
MAYPTGFEKRELGLSQLTRVMVAVGEKMNAVIRMEKQRRWVRNPHAVVVWGGWSETGGVPDFGLCGIFLFDYPCENKILSPRLHSRSG